MILLIPLLNILNYYLEEEDLDILKEIKDLSIVPTPQAVRFLNSKL